MGCDIHLYVEVKNKEFEYSNWKSPAFDGEFSVRTYKMYAALNNVRNSWGITPLEDRGLPDDIGQIVFSEYFKRVNIEQFDTAYGYCEDHVNQWVKSGASVIKEIDGDKYCSCPDWHSPNWCTASELESCYKLVFKKKNNDYAEWLALIDYMKALQKQYEVRAVFWFDN